MKRCLSEQLGLKPRLLRRKFFGTRFKPRLRKQLPTSLLGVVILGLAVISETPCLGAEVTEKQPFLVAQTTPTPSPNPETSPTPTPDSSPPATSEPIQTSPPTELSPNSSNNSWIMILFLVQGFIFLGFKGYGIFYTQRKMNYSLDEAVKIITELPKTIKELTEKVEQLEQQLKESTGAVESKLDENFSNPIKVEFLPEESFLSSNIQDITTAISDKIEGELTRKLGLSSITNLKENNDFIQMIAQAVIQNLGNDVTHEIAQKVTEKFTDDFIEKFAKTVTEGIKKEIDFSELRLVNSITKYNQDYDDDGDDEKDDDEKDDDGDDEKDDDEKDDDEKDDDDEKEQYHPTQEERELIKKYNLKSEELEESITEVSVDQDNIEKGREGAEYLAKFIKAKGLYWVITTKDGCYLVPNYNKFLNSHKLNAMRNLFELRGYEEGGNSNNFEIVKLAKVSSTKSGEEWILAENGKGILNFKPG